MSEGHELIGKRVSSDEAFRDVTRLRSQLEKVKKELKAVKKDRDDLLTEYEDLYSARYPEPPQSPKEHSKRDFTRLIVNDIHGSLMDRDAVDAFLNDIPLWSPSEVVINGDLIECGGWLAKHHTLGFVAQTDYSFQQDIAAANWFLDQIQERAPEAVIHFIAGNHDDRIEKWIVDQTMAHNRDAEFLTALCGPRQLLRLDERGIAYYERSKVHQKGLPPGWIKLGKVHFTHDLGTSKHAASSAISKTAGNVVFAHSHREDSATMVLPGVGLVKAWNPGCLCQLQPLWRHSDPTNWSHGYAVQMVDKAGNFLHHNIPIWEGRSLVGSLARHLRS